MAFIKEYKKLFREINKNLNEWNKLGSKPNEVRYAESLLSAFYESIGKSPKVDDRFNLRIKYTEEQQEELEEIAQAVANFDNIEPTTLYDKKFIEKFKKAKGKADINTIEDYVKFIDRKNIFEQERLLSSVLSWYEYNELLKRTKDKDLTSDDLNSMIVNTYKRKGLQHDTLYEYIYRKLR